MLWQSMLNSHGVPEAVAANDSGWLVLHKVASIDAVVRQHAAAKPVTTKAAFEEMQPRLNLKFANGSLAEKTRHQRMAAPTEHALFD